MNGDYNSMLQYGMQNRFAGVGGTYNGSSSPFYTISNQYIPRDLKSLLKWVDYILGQAPIVTETLRKYATYPITEFVHESSTKIDKERFALLYKKIGMKAFSSDAGMSYFSKGNAFISLHFKIHRSLVCPKCDKVHSIETLDFKLVKDTLEARCPACQYVGPMQRKDTQIRSIHGLKLVMWNPMQVTVNHNAITGRSDYYYSIPQRTRNAILMGDRLFLEDSPWEFILCAIKNKELKLNGETFYHMKNISISQHIEGIGLPPLISLYHLVFYEAMLRKANEAIASEYLMPLRIVSPAPMSGQSDPIANASMRTFVSNMTRMVQQHRRDGNHIGFSPIPISYQPISGEGRTLLVNQEIANAQQTMLLGMGVSQELLSGTSNWTSSTVGLRMLANMLGNYVGQLEEFYEWFNRLASAYLKTADVKTTLVPFKLTDDSENKQYLQALYSAGKISDTTMMEVLGIDFDKEQELIIKDAARRAAMEVKLKSETDMAVFAASKEVMEDRENKGTGDYSQHLEAAQMMAEEIVNMPEADRRAAINQLEVQDYAKYLMVSKLVETMRTQQTRENNAAMEQQGGADDVMNTPQAEELEPGAQGGSPAQGGLEEKPQMQEAPPPSFSKDAPVN